MYKKSAARVIIRSVTQLTVSYTISNLLLPRVSVGSAANQIVGVIGSAFISITTAVVVADKIDTIIDELVN